MVLDCIMSLVKVVLEYMLQALEFLMSMFVKVLKSTIQVLELVMFMFTAVLQSMPSAFEMCACFVVVDGGDGKILSNRSVQYDRTLEAVGHARTFECSLRECLLLWMLVEKSVCTHTHIHTKLLV